jgi:hypothetical protein
LAPGTLSNLRWASAIQSRFLNSETRDLTFRIQIFRILVCRFLFKFSCPTMSLLLLIMNAQRKATFTKSQ